MGCARGSCAEIAACGVSIGCPRGDSAASTHRVPALNKAAVLSLCSTPPAGLALLLPPGPAGLPRSRAEAGSARTKGSPGSAPSPCTSQRRLLKRREWSRFQHLPRGPRGHAAASPPSPCIRCRSRGHASPAQRGGTAAGRPEASGAGGGTARTQRRFPGAAPRLLAAAGAAGVRLPPAVQLVHPGAAGLGHGTPAPR